MDATGRFLIDGNFFCFFERTLYEAEARDRAALSNLVMERENEFARRSERLDAVDIHTAPFESLIKIKANARRLF